jgi:hypothetical protein
MPWFQELTKWDNSQQKNHCYLLNDSRSRVYAYVKFGSNQVEKFSNPGRFCTRGRKFQKIPNQWNVDIDTPQSGRSWSVLGSRGDTYTVTQQLNQWHCSCSGFTFRNRCRHIEQIKSVS